MNNREAKRYACDRCREQKLRCPRNQPGDSTCNRCLRLGALCVTSSGRPLGRPSLQVSEGTHGHVHGNQSFYHARRSHTPGRQGLCISTASNPFPSPHGYPVLAASGSDSSGMSSLFAHPPAHSDVMLNMRLDELDFPSHSSSSPGSNLDFSITQPQFSSDSTSGPDLEFGKMGDVAKSLTPGFYNPTGDADDNDSRQSESSMSTTSVNSDSMAFLTGIIGNISRQLAELKSQSWESWDSYLTRAALFDGHDPNITCSGPVGLNPLDITLWVTTRFALVLQTMVPPHSSTAPPSCSPPTLSVTLMLLSTYIRVGELFYTILTRINNFLQEVSGLSEPLPSAVPAVAWRQIPVGLHIIMMIQAFEHQLHTVERLMGLPADHRLWSRRDAYAGILDQEESSVLTKAVMGQVQETFRSLKRTIDSIRFSLRGPSSSLQNSAR